jgi:hypothetical protein
MSKQTPAAVDPEIFAAVFSENWDNARHIKSERISFMNAYSVICAGVLALHSERSGKRPDPNRATFLHDFILTNRVAHEPAAERRVGGMPGKD